MFRFMHKSNSKKSPHYVYYRLIKTIMMTALLLFLVVALATFSWKDPSWFSFTTANDEPHNRAGIVGAYSAALFFYLFGLGAYLFPIICAYALYWTWRGFSWSVEWERVTALVALVVCSATLSSIYGLHVGTTLPGGAFGVAFARLLFFLFDSIGALLFLYALLLASFVLLLRSWCIYLLDWCAALIQYIFSRRFAVFIHKGLQKIVVACVVPMRIGYRWVVHLWKGSLVHNKTDSFVEFEYLDNEHHDFSDLVIKPILQPHESVIDQAAQMPVTESLEEKNNEIRHVADPAQEPEDAPSTNLPKYQLPKLDIFIGVPDEVEDKDLILELEQRAKVLEEKLGRFGVQGAVVGIKRGPVVTLFEYKPHIDSKLSKIVALEDDLALALQALSIRIIAPIPGKSLVGFEVANNQRKLVNLANVITSLAYTAGKAVLPLVLGEDTIGENVIVDLARMPHLLVAGSTGSGKSVALNAMLVSLLCKLTPDELRIILIDPKRLEFAPYADIAHLLFPIVTDPKRAAPILKWVVNTMEERYERMAQWGVRNIFDYQAQVAKKGKDELMPFIVVIIDELADLMMTAGRDIEDLIARITQMARAAGIHLIVATQRPSVDVITGLIKVNFPSRIAFRVTSKIDSRTILDCGGADKLLGKGDMLFLDAQGAQLRRVHGAYVTDAEINDLVEYIRNQQQVEYLDIQEVLAVDGAQSLDADDELYDQIREFVLASEEVSISLLQRKFRIGYNRSARLIDKLESQGLLLPADGSKMRKVIR